MRISIVVDGLAVINDGVLYTLFGVVLLVVVKSSNDSVLVVNLRVGIVDDGITIGASVVVVVVVVLVVVDVPLAAVVLGELQSVKRVII